MTLNKGLFLIAFAAFVAFGPALAQACISNYYQMCQNNSLYWYDSCGNQQLLSQYCQYGCQNGACVGYNNNYNNLVCNYHAYRLCVGNSLYWYDSCGAQQDIYQNCQSLGQVCKESQCQNYVAPLPPQPVYNPHYRTACYGSSIYWYDSLGRATGLNKSCDDGNSCTADSCAGRKCANELKCDGTTCPNSSDAYKEYCQGQQQNNNQASFVVSFFAKPDQNSQWSKEVQVKPDSQQYFMVSVGNTSQSQIDNVKISANIPSEISSLGNLQLNGAPVSGDIVSGIDIGSLPAGSGKTVTFEGRTQAIASQNVAQATTKAEAGQASQSDFITLTFAPSTGQPAAVSTTQSTGGFAAFLKRWYLWILIGVVLVFLFYIVFKRLSSST